jgi:glycosyltransferase involved in cell wall biosynthesis
MIHRIGGIASPRLFPHHSLQDVAVTATLDLTLLMPCLNEAETLTRCIEKAQGSLAALGLSGEVLIADNGSTDGSIALAEKLGARVVPIAEKGYGSALRGGIATARGRWIIMGDADDSYDFSAIAPFVEKLREGRDLVMGCRMPRGGGTLLPGAMPWKHRWIGNPALSFIGRLFFKCPVQDVHCGLRGFSADACRRMKLRTTGMEFASEMVIKATLLGMRIAEVPITLHKDGRSRPPHLRSWRDGWRHLRFMLLYSPRWLFLAPGLALAAIGLVGMLLLSSSTFRVGAIVLDAGALAMFSMALLVGCQLVAFAWFTKVFATSEGLLPQDASFARWFRLLNLEKGIALGGLVFGSGVLLFLRAWMIWRQADYGPLAYSENLRRLIPSATLITLGVQIVFSSFFMSVLGLKTSGRTPPTLNS